MSERAHGIMFHHFHDKQKHIVGQGSISGEKFDDMLSFYKKTHNIISAKDFLEKSTNGTLSEKDVCLTFDDGLLCQFDIAYPILKQRNLTAFWFFYTSPLNGILEKLEVYRHFRFSMFPDIEEFYSAFFAIAKREYEKILEELRTFNPDNYLKNFPFYTPNDKRFRYLRDVVLGESRYNAIMDSMLLEYHYNVQENAEKLWIKEAQIRELHDNGHIIGLHSYSHPTRMIKKNLREQRTEYGTNKRQLETIIRDKVISASYPCNSYNSDTLKCMNELNIEIGFRANMEEICLENMQLEYPREDHANILKTMEEKK